MRFTVGPSGPLRGECRVPSDKSIAHRALICCALAQGRSTLSGWRPNEDNLNTLQALRRLAVEIREDGDVVEIEGVGLDGLSPCDRLECGNAGTALRLFCGVCAGFRGHTTILDGDDSLRRRPMRRVQVPLEAMGAVVSGVQGGGDEILPPLAVRGGHLRGIRYDLPIASAQVKSAVLLAALRAEGPTHLREPAQSRDHTERLLRMQGAPLSIGDTLTLDPSGWSRCLSPLQARLPGDLSAAAFLLVAATLLPGSDIVVRDVGVNPTRTGILDALEAMGARIELENCREEGGEPIADLRVRSGELRGTTLAGAKTLRAIDEVPILGVAATRALGATTIRDASELRTKESDRLAVMTRALRRLGCEVTETADGLQIEEKRPAYSAQFTAQEVSLDHRVAMSLAIAGMIGTGQLEIEGAEIIATSFPGFVETLAALGATISCEA